VSHLIAVEGDRKLDRFELVAELASGGMATVFLARLSGVGGFQRLVAIKRLHPHLAREPDFIQMFLDEARLAARIHHPNVVPILEIGESPQGYYIVMEYIEGDTLGRILARSVQSGTKLPMNVGLRVLIDMLAGLHAAHELTDDEGNPLGIVHRDVSPQNVLVGVDGSSRLSDFGVARATSKLSTTRTGQLKGKLAYMAPEQARTAKDIDRRADIFAAGIVLWEVLACKRLFKGEGEAETLNKVINEPIPAVRAIAPTVPAALDAVVSKALERDRALRFATAAEFADALERAARVAGALGSHKEVAAHLESVLGTEIHQQRDAVRAWLLRSDPSRSGPKLPPVPGSDPSGVTSGARARSAGEGTPSVVSAVISNNPPVPAPGFATLPVVQTSAPARGRALPWVLLIAVCVVGGVAWLRWGRTSSTPAAAAPIVSVAGAGGASVTATAAVPSASMAQAPTVSLPSAAASADASPGAASAPASAPGPATVAAGRGWRRGPPAQPPAAPQTPPAATTASPAPTTTVPDDISRNPYR
jgi:serine/threonine protein kinase